MNSEMLNVLKQIEKEKNIPLERLLGFIEDARSYETAHGILSTLQIDTIRLMTNNPLKVQALEQAGINVCERVDILVGVNAVNRSYLQSKQERMGHLLSLDKHSS